MKQLFKSKPILSFTLLTLSITLTFWFLPVVVTLPKDIGFGAILIGGCGPLIAGYLLTVINSGEIIKIGSRSIFFTVFLVSALVLFLRLYFVNNGLSDANGKIPSLNEVGILAFVTFGLLCFILALNLSNATNSKLKENYLNSSFFESGKARWYVIGFSLFILLNICSYFIGGLLNLKTTDFIIKTEPTWLIGFISNFLFFGGIEEFGWRGFLQKELQKKYNPLIGTLVVSLSWSLWLLPLHFNGFYSTGGFIDWLPLVALMIPLTITYTWVYNKSSYSILAVILLHAMFNNVNGAVGKSELVFLVLGISFSIFCIFDDKMWKMRSFEHIYNSKSE